MSGEPRSVADVRSVYVHAPFCARRCVYCDFAVSVRREGDVGAWLEALSREFERVEAEGLFLLAPRLDTLYVGGGTPSLLGPAAMRGLADLLSSDRLSSPTLEWTAEANPESFTAEVASAWAEAGVNRLSLGVQTFDDGALAWMGRLHGSEGGARAVSIARRAGLTEIGIDLIFGLPSHLRRSWDDDLARALDLGVSHVSLYGLTVESGTTLGRAVREGREPPVEEEGYRGEYLRAAEVLVGAGFEHYEVSNFALPGSRARHNAVYWRGEPYLGLGNGAHSFARPVRRWNVRSWEDYRGRLEDGAGVEEGREVVDGDAAALEDAWLALRTSEGIARPEAGSAADAAVDGWCRRDLAVRCGDRVRLTPVGWLLLDTLAVELDSARGRRAPHGAAHRAGPGPLARPG